MLGQNNKEAYRIRFELAVDQINVSCADTKQPCDINRICLQLNYSGPAGKEVLRTECISSAKRTSLTEPDYVLTWKHVPVLKFSVTLPKRKGLYEKSSKCPELFVSRVDENDAVHKLGSVKLDLSEHANQKLTGHLYESEEDKISVNLKNTKKLLSCELLAKFRIMDTDPSVIEADTISSKRSSAITPSVSTETINSQDRAFTNKTLKRPIYKLLDEIHLIGPDGNLYFSNWSTMHLIFFIFGTMPDFMANLKDLIQQLRSDRTIGQHIEVVHICQGELAAADVLWPYLPQLDDKNSEFHDIFNIQQPFPKICVVNKRMTEYFTVEANMVEKFTEEHNVIDLYYLWNHIKPTHHHNHGPSRSVSCQDNMNSDMTRCSNVPKSSSLNFTGHNRSCSSGDGSSLPRSPSRSSLINKVPKVTDSQEYRSLESKLSETSKELSTLQSEHDELLRQMEDMRLQNMSLETQITKLQTLGEQSIELLADCQKENVFFRHQVLLRAHMSLRSGTFNLFKTRWFQLETLSSQTISPVISFYNGPDRLGQIMLSDIRGCEELTDTQFKITTEFAAYVINAEDKADTVKWIDGIKNLQRTFGSDVQLATSE